MGNVDKGRIKAVKGESKNNGHLGETFGGRPIRIPPEDNYYDEAEDYEIYLDALYHRMKDEGEIL